MSKTVEAESKVAESSAISLISSKQNDSIPSKLHSRDLIQLNASTAKASIVSGLATELKNI
jgi:hypothetical protein